jgi:hypothetical protein
MSETCSTCKHERKGTICCVCHEYDLWSPRPYGLAASVIFWLFIAAALTIGLWGTTP